MKMTLRMLFTPPKQHADDGLVSSPAAHARLQEAHRRQHIVAALDVDRGQYAAIPLPTCISAIPTDPRCRWCIHRNFVQREQFLRDPCSDIRTHREGLERVG